MNQPYDHKRIEREVQDHWKRERIPERIADFHSSGKAGKKKFYLLDGPPYVNGIPHVGHVKTTTFKDVWGKFKAMQGHSVWFQPGFDCSGLPIENAVEKKLGIKSKKDIEEKIGLENFIKACRELAEQNLHLWMNLYKELGAWRGWQEPYLTYKDYYLESGWWTIKRMHEKGLLVEGTKPSFWCPHCETVLSGYEVTDSYKNMEDPSIFIKFPVKGAKNEYLLVWTTTPWTLPANVAIAAHPDETYVRARIGTGEILILAEKRLPELERFEIGYTVLERFHGKRLEGMRYEPALDVPLQHELEKNDKAHQVILSIPIMKKRVASKTLTKKATEEKDEFGHVVDMETGSGLVHIAPGHGEVDNRLGKHYKLPEPSPVDDRGMLTREAGVFGEHFVKKADPLIIESLEKAGRLLRTEKITHSYPLCWRCKSPLIYRMSRQWFLTLDPIRKKIISENRKVRWLPGFGGERFENLMQEAPDWAITRQRYWGIPIPIWVCPDCGEKKVIGSRKELEEVSGHKVEDLHKDSVDRIVLHCGECKGKMSRVKDIMDVWFDSGISPWASIGYPFRNRELFERLWPVDLVDESQDQIRGWFYSLMMCGFSVFGRAPYHTVCLNGWTLDEKGEKMSKSLGNVIDASEARNQLGSDLLRLYYCYDTAPWETQKFSMANARDLHRVMNVLWNTYVFIDTYCKKGHHALPEGLKQEDRWILSRINTVAEKVTEDMENFRLNSASRSLVDFLLNDFSRKYIKLIRNRVSPWYEGKDKAAAQLACVYVLEKAVRLMAPMTPFITEKIYMSLGRESVHLAEWPDIEKSLIDGKLEENMMIADSLIESLNSARQEAGVKLKWPLLEIHVHPKDKKAEDAVANLKEIIQNMGNVRNVILLKKLPKEGKRFEHGEFVLGEVLMNEALVRELIRKIQMLRKEEKLKVTQRISLVLETDSGTQEKLHSAKSEVLEGVGAGSLEFRKLKEEKGKLEFEGAKVRIWFGVER
ncbi:MAG TPA: isoleucine--tRNA ligase [archaeon]|nr:isoleucine--tRNA ligase [archaeon]